MAPPTRAPSKETWLWPENISTYGAKVDYLFFVILAITLFMMILVFALMIFFLVRYRYQEGRRAIYSHGNNKIEVFWTVATSAILVVLVFMQRATWEEIKQRDLSPEGIQGIQNPFLVRVFGEQFAWHFVYPGPDGQFEPTAMDRVFVNINPLGMRDPKADIYSQVLTVPANTPVILELNSIGKINQENQQETLPVLHSFFSPHLRFKQDIVPFNPAKVWFEATKTGTYEITCAELCGLGHYTMRADFRILGEEELKTALGYDWKAQRASFETPK